MGLIVDVNGWVWSCAYLRAGLELLSGTLDTNMLGRFAIRAGDFGLVARPCCTCWLSSGHWAQQTSASGVSHPLGNLELHSYGSFMLRRCFLQNLRSASDHVYSVHYIEVPIIGNYSSVLAVQAVPSST